MSSTMEASFYISPQARADAAVQIQNALSRPENENNASLIAKAHVVTQLHDHARTMDRISDDLALALANVCEHLDDLDNTSIDRDLVRQSLSNWLVVVSSTEEAAHE